MYEITSLTKFILKFMLIWLAPICVHFNRSILGWAVININGCNDRYINDVHEPLLQFRRLSTLIRKMLARSEKSRMFINIYPLSQSLVYHCERAGFGTPILPGVNDCSLCVVNSKLLL